MCYHISFQVNLESIFDYFPDLIVDNQLDVEFPVSSYLNGFDHPSIPVVLRGRKDNKLHLANMVWGYLPNGIKNAEEAERFWNGYKDDSGKYNKGFITLNAIGEELLLPNKMYREAALTRRCVITCDGIFEWRHVFPMGKKGQPLKTPIKYPYHIHLNGKKPAILMAGVWNAWRHFEVDKSTGEVVPIYTATFAIITTKANVLMAKVHNSKERMTEI